ncbi:single-stranded DNA-binding protein [Elizabethkingia anophelis]|nr:single-stranded DNA-binding protein [Elizabethkingia anophelis]MDV3600983.1 single-stranded DNA-binding protein [Elizabethkingia anophelis]MDV3606948.1 single-stranded DNA-binding protein [Elizabethkingia anophelis]MDV3640048.1 single-stranded DNA-binding protein [Elizabethkingia anophelis]MDV3649502.1 single-stranded DNA-binding protein [Elizabethkingia anophelis]
MNTIIGRVTKNAEIKNISNDRQVVNFSVAINDSYITKQGEHIKQATFYNCSYWISTKIAEFLTKGTLVELFGRTTSNAWIGRNGEVHSRLNFHTSKIKLHGGRKKNDQPIGNTTSTIENKAFADESEDDLPF